MEIGQHISGRYKIIKPIGSGGMANVYLAEDLILERQVAVKVTRYDFRNDESSIRRFKREALASTELVHPNIVSIYDVGQEENPYIVMEYVKGTDLKEYIQENFPIPYRKTLDIMSQILSAVEYAHQNGLVHRDLKPQNILIDEEDHVKITDFGIAVALSQNSITQTNSLLGSVHYISPEQARGGMATKQSDIYSLGILLYELLTSEVPFDGESAVSIALKHFQDPLPSIRDLDPHVPQALENVVLKATAKEKEQRYQTVKEMAADLETALLPERADEPKFIPQTNETDETMQFQPISAGSQPIENVKDTIVAAPVEPSEPTSKPAASEEDKPSKKGKKKKRRWLVPLLAILLGLTVILIYLFSGTDDVQIPEVSGMTEAEAVQALLAVNLVLGDTIPESSEEIEEGRVTRTTPAVNSTVAEQTEVDLFISTGRETVAFQDYEGEPFEEARARLTELGFTVEREDDNSDTVPEGNIISQSIAEGEEVIPDETTIVLTVSEGEAGFQLRDLSNYSLASLQDYIRDNDLNLTLEEAHSETVREGQVISQQPEAGATVFSNDYVTAVMSLGPEEVQVHNVDVTFTVQYQAPETTEENTEDDTSEETNEEEGTEEPQEQAPNVIEVYVEDRDHNLDELYTEPFEIREDIDLTLTLILEEGTTGRYRVVRDGEMILEDEATAPGS